jgi:hypothetical protein
MGSCGRLEGKMIVRRALKHFYPLTVVVRVSPFVQVLLSTNVTAGGG